MANELTFNQISTVLNSIYEQATGRTAPVATDTGSFVTQAQTVLKAGYDPTLNAISQVLSRTIFSIRPYSRKFPGIEVDEIKWGNHVRKLNAIDTPFQDDGRYDIEDGTSVDMFKVKKAKVLQTNFYGQEVFEFQSPTYFRDQLDVAFSGPQEFARYITMITTNASDIIEQGYEGLARMLVANLIGASSVVSADAPEKVVHCVTEYNDYAGTSLTSDTVKAPENWKEFSRWLFARIRTLRELMTERTIKYQLNITDKAVTRHTPLSRQKIYLLADIMNHIDSEVLSVTYNDKYLNLGDHEVVNFWQSPEQLDHIEINPSFIDTNGEIAETAPVNLDNVIGVIFDEEAIGYTRANQWSGVTPFNVKGGYYNEFYHSTGRWWTDMTEKSVVLLLD